MARHGSALVKGRPTNNITDARGADHDYHANFGTPEQQQTCSSSPTLLPTQCLVAYRAHDCAVRRRSSSSVEKTGASSNMGAPTTYCFNFR